MTTRERHDANNIEFGEDQNQADQDQLLAWRRDQEESFSDWKIEVIQQFKDGKNDREEDENQEGNFTKPAADNNDDRRCETSTVYHVHRLFLASGPRKCEYFKTLFTTQAATFVEQDNQRTKLVMPESACRAFPPFLDFLYGGKEHLTMKDRTAVALHYLADYLQCYPLRALADEFIQKHLKASNVHIYCREGLLYGVDWVVDECTQVAADFPEELLPAEAVSPSASMELLSPSSTSSSLESSGAAAAEENMQPRVRDVMAMLPPTHQVKLLQLSLTKSLQELKQFKRVPSQWKESIKDDRATHLPTIATIHYPKQGSCLEFPGRTCPLFYFDQAQTATETAAVEVLTIDDR